MRLTLFILSIIIVGCTKMCSLDRKSMTAKQVVEAYLEIAFNIQKTNQKNLLMQYTTGHLKNAIAGATDETIKEAYIKSRYTLKNMYIVEQNNKTPRETEITYQLKYKEIPENQKISESSLITTENRVSLIKEKGRWYIQGVLSKKTSIEFPLLDMSIIKPNIK